MTGNELTLREAIQQTLDGKLSGPILLRRFMTHDDWRVPIHVDAAGKQLPVYIRDSDNQRFALYFTDEQGYQDGRAAIGAELMGERVLRLAGRDLFVELSDDADIISINWNSPPQIFFKRAQVPALRRWAQAVSVEHTLMSPTPNLGLLKRFDAYYIVLQKIEGGFALVLAPDAQNRKIAAVFTAEDTLDAFLKDDKNSKFEFEPVTRTIPGQHLFEDLRDMPLDGISFNCVGPVPQRRFAAGLANAVVTAP